MDSNMGPIIPLGNEYPGFIPGVFSSTQDRDEYLSSLDSDTRDYVLKHTDEFSTKADLMECVNKLHGQG